MLSSEHLHVALNHFPILGLPLAAFVAGCGLATKNRGTLRVGLFLVAVCAAFTVVVMKTGENAADAYDGADFVDSAGYAWMTGHGERAAKAALAIYAAGVVALAGLALTFVAEKISRIAGAFALVLATVAAGLAIWTADAGGKIRRPDFREKSAGTPSTTQPVSE